MCNSHECFVNDWYRVRIDNNQEREASIKDLVRILQDENHLAIRELAENPLLLTIVALVHRIDAVLPDERVVLYQKCTETLLNTWHTWKFKESGKNRGVIERRNRRRMESIAYWMQFQSTGVGKTQRSVVPYQDLLDHLTKYISDVEKVSDPENEPVDLANDFIDFIKNRAGLLIEVGDQSYSFVHLTFQEYLTATYLTANSEKDGIANMDSDLLLHAKDSRWYEVIRLLVAGLKSEDSQEYIIDKILSAQDHNKRNISPLLLGGLLLDGVSAANTKKYEILEHVILSGVEAQSSEETRQFTSILKNWINKEPLNQVDIENVYKKLWQDNVTDSERIKYLLLSTTANLDSPFIKEAKKEVFDSRIVETDYFRLFFSGQNKAENFNLKVANQLKSLEKAQNLSLVTSPYLNFIAVILQSISFLYDNEFAVKSTFNQLLIALGTGSNYGPFEEFSFNTLLIANSDKKFLNSITNDAFKTLRKDRFLRKKHIVDKAIESLIEGFHHIVTKLNKEVDKHPTAVLRRAIREDINSDTINSKVNITNGIIHRDLFSDFRHIKNEKNDTWQLFQNTPKLYTPLLELIVEIFELQPNALWFEALRMGFLPIVSDNLFVKNLSELDSLIHDLKSGNPVAHSIYLSAILLLFDTWVTVVGLKTNPYKAVVEEIALISQQTEYPPLLIASYLRSLAFGDTSITEKLKDKFDSAIIEYNVLFQNCYWKDKGLNKKNIKSKNQKI